MGGLAYLNPNDPGIFRVQRGKPGADELMAPDVGRGGRYFITTGEAAMVNGASAALPSNWRRVFDPHSPAFGFLAIGVLLLLIHASAGFNAAFGVRGGVRR